MDSTVIKWRWRLNWIISLIDREQLSTFQPKIPSVIQKRRNPTILLCFSPFILPFRYSQQWQWGQRWLYSIKKELSHTSICSGFHNLGSSYNNYLCYMGNGGGGVLEPLSVCLQTIPFFASEQKLHWPQPDCGCIYEHHFQLRSCWHRRTSQLLISHLMSLTWTVLWRCSMLIWRALFCPSCGEPLQAWAAGSTPPPLCANMSINGNCHPEGTISGCGVLTTQIHCNT